MHIDNAHLASKMQPTPLNKSNLMLYKFKHVYMQESLIPLSSMKGPFLLR